MLQYKGKGKNAYFCVVSIIYTLSHCCDHNMKQKHLLLFTLRGLQSITGAGGGRQGGAAQLMVLGVYGRD